MTSSAAAYSATGGRWEQGPARIYDRLAAVLVSRSPVPLGGRCVVDVGAGTGAGSRAALAAGAAGVVAVDAAYGMLAHDARARPAAVVGDIVRLPFATSTFGAAVAAFSLNHLEDPTAGLREMARVTRAGGTLLAATYAEDDDHPVKLAVAAALAARGWAPAPWYRSMAATVVPLLAVPERFATVATQAGLAVDVEAVRVPFPELRATDLVAWRLGMAQHAPFVAALSEGQREAVAADALDRLGDGFTPLVRSIVVLTAVIG